MTIQSLDIQLLLLINHGMANAFLDILMPALSLRGYLLVIPYLLAMLLISANRRDRDGRTYISTAVWALLIAFGAWYLSEWAEDALKIAVARERPCRLIPDLRLLIPCPKSFSMPSGHAITSFAVATPLFYLPRAYIALIWRLYPVVLASFIAFSRLYLGVHYPTDVLAGTFLGILIGLAPSILYQALATEEIVKRRKA
ncbi:MAG TPA: phosphatase PAP2 family protein [Nitrospirota bacterium]